MNAEEHSQHAEQLLDWASDDDVDDPVTAYRITKAHAHATLAAAGQTARVAEWLRDIAGQLDGLQLPGVVIVPEGSSLEEIVGEIERLRTPGAAYAGVPPVSSGTLPGDDAAAYEELASSFVDRRGVPHGEAQQ